MKTILLIEDNNDIRENTTELLELKGYQVISAANGRSGLALAKENKPDVILCDIFMPETDGYEVLTTLRNDSEISSTPFIFLSASVEKKEVDKAFTMGVHGYIRKPFEAEELFSTIENFLEEK